MRRVGQIVGVAMVGIAIISAAVAGAEVKSKPPAPAAALSRVQLAPVRSTMVAAKSEVTGALQPARALQLGFEVGGRLAQLYVKKGAPVQAGQLIAKLDPEIADAQVAQAEAALKVAEASAAQANDSAQRTAQLRSSSNVSDQQASAAANQALAADAQVLAAKAQLAQSRAQRRRHELRAPFSGVLVDAPEQAGAYVTSATLLFSLEQLDPLVLHATAAESERALLKPGARVRVESTGSAAASDDATLTSIIPSADPLTRRVPIEISVPNKRGLFTAHTLARAILPLGAEAPALQVSASALASTGGDHLFVLDAGGTVRRVPIAVLERGAKDVVFRLAEGETRPEQVIDFPAVDLDTGMKVSVR